MIKRKYTKKNPKFFKNIRETNGIKEKLCAVCKEWKPESTEFFYMRNKMKPEKGFNSECKQCSIKSIQSRYDKQKKSDYNKQHYDNNYDYYIEKAKRNYRNNPDLYHEKDKKWRLKNRDKVNFYALKRRLHKKHDISHEEWDKCKEFFNYRCAYCNLHIDKNYRQYAGESQQTDFCKDHAINIGSDKIDNCLPSCWSCNSSKNEMDWTEWYVPENPIYTEINFNKIILWFSRF